MNFPTQTDKILSHSCLRQYTHRSWPYGTLLQLYVLLCYSTLQQAYGAEAAPFPGSWSWYNNALHCQGDQADCASQREFRRPEVRIRLNNNGTNIEQVPLRELYPAAVRRFLTPKSDAEGLVVHSVGCRDIGIPAISQPSAREAPACCSTVGANLSGWRPERLIGAVPCLVGSSPFAHSACRCPRSGNKRAALPSATTAVQPDMGTDELVAFRQVPCPPRLPSSCLPLSRLLLSSCLLPPCPLLPPVVPCPQALLRFHEQRTCFREPPASPE